MESFEVPALLGLPVGIHVYTSSIYQAIHQYPSQVGLASAYAVTLLLLISIAVYAQSRFAQEESRYSTVTGKGFRPRTIEEYIGQSHLLAPGKPLALVGSSGLLEIAVRDGSAEQLLKVTVGDEVRVE